MTTFLADSVLPSTVRIASAIIACFPTLQKTQVLPDAELGVLDTLESARKIQKAFL